MAGKLCLVLTSQPSHLQQNAPGPADEALPPQRWVTGGGGVTQERLLPLAPRLLALMVGLRAEASTNDSTPQSTPALCHSPGALGAEGS